MKKYNIPFSPPDISEEEINEVIDTLKSGWITTGPKTKELERRLSEFTSTPKTVCLNSATAALELTLRVLGIGEGDEVIVPAMTYTASCSVIYHVGAKAVVPVDLAGIPCDYDKIFEVVESKKHLFKANSEYQEKLGRVAVVADGAHALGSTYKGKKIGSVADFTTFSFHAVKNFTTAEGGSVTWKQNENFDNEELYREYQIYSLHGQTKDALAKTKAGSWEYDIVIPGYKCNLTDIAASIGLVQLDRYPKLLERRDNIISQYNKGFEGTRITTLSHSSEEYKSCGHLYITHVEGATFEQRGEIIVKMAERGISCNVHYKPLPLLTAYRNLGFDIENYPNAYNYYVKEITLPLHTRLTDEDVAVIIENFKEIVQEVVGE